MGCSKLSHKLLDLGFFSALGTSEHPGGRDEELHVRRGRPNTQDSNNGVTVVYDEDGRPWIRSIDSAAEEFQRDRVGYRGTLASLFLEHDLHQGAYVPHSNDGSHFVREVIPTLVARS